MILLRIFWALFLAGMVAYTFNRSWRWEHGEPMPETLFGSDKPRTKETIVWLDPSFLPVLLLIILIMFRSIYGSEGVDRFMSLSLDVMILISFYFVLLIFLLPVFRKFFSARACATMWILPVFMFWQVHILIQNTPAPSFVIYIPSHILGLLYFIWSIGFVVVYAGKFLSHFLFRYRVMSASIPVRDPEILELFEQELNQLEYYRPVKLVQSSAVTVPLSMGTMKRTRVTVLPNQEFTKQELQFIFRHEIHHIQRGDVSNKMFFAFCQALCWFNPLIWVATRKASDDLELSCDEIVLEDMDDDKRRQYANLLLDTAGSSRGFTTCLSAAAETMRYRLKNVVAPRKRWSGTILLFVAMFLCVMSHGVIAVSNDRGSVAELITEYRTAEDIRSVYYQPEGETLLSEVYDWNNEELFSYLTSLEVDKISSGNEIENISDHRIAVIIDKNGTMELTIDDKLLEVYRFHHGGKKEFYYLRSKVDWDVIQGYLDFDAEKPVDPTMFWPEMQVHFDVLEQDEAIFAVRNKLRVWDIETGETLRASSNSESPGGLQGLRPIKAQLVFDMPVSEISVWMREWESSDLISVTLEAENGCFFIPMNGNSAHYQVDVLYEPLDGVRYEATYVFDVEYPE